MRAVMIQNSLNQMTLFETEKHYRNIQLRMRKNNIYFSIWPEANIVVITLKVLVAFDLRVGLVRG